jgi:hypothetical protein
VRGGEARGGGRLGAMTRLQLYIDDSGTRRPDRAAAAPRVDGMDHFALGGILIREEAVSTLIKAHHAFTTRWRISAPLHSTKIRGRRDTFKWLRDDADLEVAFWDDLEKMIIDLPILCLACVVHRPGYVSRYAERYKQPWLLCKTAFAILVERAAKYAARSGAHLEIYFEEAGKQEDRAIQAYARLLETEGMPFDPDTSKSYDELKPEDFKKILVGQPNRIKKKVPMAQIADLVLYPMVKRGYDPLYRPYVQMMKGGRIIDACLNPDERPVLGVKYSCFDKKQSPV